MQLDERIARLIAVGASVVANCQPCLAANIGQALQAGAGQGQVAQAIAIGRWVRQGAASKMDGFIAALPDLPAALLDAGSEACECGGKNG